MNSFFLRQLEKALNRYLALDPESKKRLQRLEGKTITLELEVLRFCFQLVIQDQKIGVHSGENLSADLKIRGTPLNLFTLALSRDKKHHFFTELVTLEGDAELGQQVIALFEQLELDWEEYLAMAIGDLPANQLGRFTKKLFAWGKDAQESLAQNLKDYVHEEKTWLPPEEALQDFFKEVDELRLDMDRFEARVRQLIEETRKQH